MPRIDPAALESFVVDLARSLGASGDTPRELATSLVEADLVGHSSHGTRLLPAKYVPEIGEDKIDPAASPRIEHETGVFITVDGRRAFGQVAARMAIDAGIDAAREHGIGVTALRNVSHIGRVGEWAERAAEAGLAVVGFIANPGSQWVAPVGSAERRFSTNPVVVGLPTYDALPFPLVLDMATSQVARGKIREREATGMPLPEGWVVDESGGPVTDAKAFEAEGVGAMLPLGGLGTGHKGFGLAVMAELLAGCGSDGSVSGQASILWGNHALFYLTDLTVTSTQDAIATRVSAMAEYVRDTGYSNAVSMPPAASGDRALLPGEAEHRTRLDRRDHGIPVPVADAAMLHDLAIAQGIDVPGSLTRNRDP